MKEGAEPRTPEEALMRLFAGRWVSAAISCAAELGIADALGDDALSLAALAERIECDASSLARLLGVLVAEGLLTQPDAGSYALTPMGRALRKEALGPVARYVGSPAAWDVWSSLPAAIRSGRSAYQERYGIDLFSSLDDDAKRAAVYHAGIDGFTRPQAAALAANVSFEGVRTVADIGGGRGTLMIELARALPALTLTLLDRPAAIRLATARFDEAGLNERCLTRAADFFEPLPGRYDRCILKQVIHNWGDEDAIRILRNASGALEAGGRIIIIDTVLLPLPHGGLGRLMDLEMLAFCEGGRERGKPELRRLLRAAGLKLEKTTLLEGATYALEASVAD